MLVSGYANISLAHSVSVLVAYHSGTVNTGKMAQDEANALGKRIAEVAAIVKRGNTN